jgi:hypothetical protein
MAAQGRSATAIIDELVKDPFLHERAAQGRSHYLTRRPPAVCPVQAQAGDRSGQTYYYPRPAASCPRRWRCGRWWIRRSRCELAPSQSCRPPGRQRPARRRSCAIRSKSAGVPPGDGVRLWPGVDPVCASETSTDAKALRGAGARRGAATTAQLVAANEPLARLFLTNAP